MCCAQGPSGPTLRHGPKPWGPGPGRAACPPGGVGPMQARRLQSRQQRLAGRVAGRRLGKAFASFRVESGGLWREGRARSPCGRAVPPRAPCPTVCHGCSCRQQLAPPVPSTETRPCHQLSRAQGGKECGHGPWGRSAPVLRGPPGANRSSVVSVLYAGHWGC